MAWSPPTPAFTEEPWRRVPLPTSDAVAPLLAEIQALKAKLAVLLGDTPVDPDQERAYLAACARRKGSALQGEHANASKDHPQPGGPHAVPTR